MGPGSPDFSLGEEGFYESSRLGNPNDSQRPRNEKSRPVSAALPSVFRCLSVYRSRPTQRSAEPELGYESLTA
jgi:hypothetical protein